MRGDKGQCEACDRAASRLQLKENTERLRLQSIQTSVGDSRNYSHFNNCAGVLLDAPARFGTHRHAMPVGGRQSSLSELSVLQANS